MVCIRYHVWWPGQNDPYYQYNTSESAARTNYYGITGVPAFKIDGFIDGGSYTSYMTRIRSRYYMESPAEIDLSGTFDDEANTGTLEISISAVEDYAWENLVVRVALTESDLYYPAPNGAVWHHQTMRDMIPNAAGTPIEIAWGETVELSRPFSVPSQLVKENCELVVFMQNEIMREVYQTARIRIDELGAVGVDDIVDLPSEFKLAQNYPNPFNANTIIRYSLEKAGEAELSVYDLSGRKVIDLVNGFQNRGEHEIIWDGLNSEGQTVATGVYFYRLKTDDNSSTKSMVLLK